MDWTRAPLETLAEAEDRYAAGATVANAVATVEAHLVVSVARARMGRRDLEAASVLEALAVLREAFEKWPGEPGIARAYSDVAFRCAADGRLRLSALQRRRARRENVEAARRIVASGLLPMDEAFERLAVARAILKRR